MPNIANVKDKIGQQQFHGNSQGLNNSKGPAGSEVLLLNTESMDRETANTSKLGGSNHKRITSNPTNYVKVQNAEVSSAGTADPTFQGGFPATNNYTTAGQNSRGNGIPHTLGNSLGGNPKQSLNMSNYGGYFSAIQRDSSLNENNTLAKTGINLTSLIRQNLLEEDGIEDLHFYFVSFQQHKKQILQIQKKRQEIRTNQEAAGKVGANVPRMAIPKVNNQEAGRNGGIQMKQANSKMNVNGNAVN